MGAVFESMRKSWRDAMGRASSPAEGRAVLAMMRDALVEAKVGVSQVRAALDKTRVQLEHERAEVQTAVRRGRMASDIHDAETARIAERYAAKHQERVAMLERKLEAQATELSLAEQELSEMTDQFHAMSTGGGTGAGTGPGTGAASSGAGSEPESPDGALEADLAGLRRAADRSAREADAERRLEELKRRMGR